MREGLIFLSLILTSCLFSQTIPWSESRKLAWEDFKAIPEDERFTASTFCLIGMIPKHTKGLMC